MFMPLSFIIVSGAVLPGYTSLYIWYIVNINKKESIIEIYFLITQLLTGITMEWFSYMYKYKQHSTKYVL